MDTDTSCRFKLALIAMPWSIFNRPSIQLGALKSYLEQEMACRVDTYHPYLHLAKSLTPEVYSQIALSGWAGEALFAPLLFPEKRADARRLFDQCLTGKIQPLPDFDDLAAQVEQHCSRWLTQINISQYKLFGFSLCFSQLFASLFMARKIKSLQSGSTNIPIVFGGSSCSGDIGTSLIEHFPEIDYLIDGEGEQKLVQLCRFLMGQRTTLSPKIHTRNGVSAPMAEPDPAPLDLNDLPYPDYRPYFQEMQQLFPGGPFIPLLPMEFSRGCWWNKCTFCNLNLQWSDYRVKESDRMLAETLHLASTHECLHFAFTDNALPPKEADRFFERLSVRGLDLDFFAEIRSTTRPNRLQKYSQAGLKTVQVGIEALSTSLLTKMAKGTTAMDNIAVMKLCSAAAIRMEGNLITDFPTTSREEITETLQNLDFVLPFLPLQAATFFLGYGSPMHAGTPLQGNQASIKCIMPHAKNRRLFPEAYLRTMTMLINSYRGDKTYQGKLWQPVRKKIAAWQNFHRKRAANRQHPLHYRDGITFLIIRQERVSGSPLLHRLRGLSRKIYLACAYPVTISSLAAAFPEVSETALRKFIDEMCLKHLMFQENNRALSLAIHCPNS